MLWLHLCEHIKRETLVYRVQKTNYINTEGEKDWKERKRLINYTKRSMERRYREESKVRNKNGLNEKKKSCSCSSLQQQQQQS